MEDDAGLARLLQKALERAGYQVTVASNGAEGLAKYAQGSFDVIAVDQNMPVQDGLQVIRTLASRGPLPPVIMITGSGSEQIAVEAMKIGALDYVVKDVDGGYLRLLPSVIEQVIQQHRLAEDKRRTDEALQQRNRELTLLNQMSRALTATLNVDQVLATLLNDVNKLLNASSSSVWLIDSEDAELICKHAIGIQSEIVRGWKLPLGEGLSGWVALRGESLLVADAQADPRHRADADERSGLVVRSFLSVPLRAREHVLGVVNIVDTAPQRFQPSDQTLLELLAASAAIAIENARLVETLRQQTIELQARNQELDAFAHTVAHDLKNPLGQVIGYAEMTVLYHDTLTDEEKVDYAQIIARSSRKMNNIIEELLLLSEVRKSEVHSMPLDMATIVAESMVRLADMIQDSQAEITLPDQWPASLGHPPWIEEVWANYLSNAIKYGGHPPRLVLGAETAPGGMVRFWVRDNGAGIEPEAQARLFTPFTRLDQIRAQGHGLGLSITRRIVEKLGGQVGVESHSGQGSIFSFTLPGA
jgi:signal transduction histidine kinase/DNA-binding response OmpR family regulator